MSTYIKKVCGKGNQANACCRQESCQQMIQQSSSQCDLNSHSNLSILHGGGSIAVHNGVALNIVLSQIGLPKVFYCTL
jgi:hypothetical protein